MVTRNSPWPAGTPCWVDLGTDVERASAFYSGLFGWKVEVGGPEVGGYANCFVGDKRVAGMGPLQDEAQQSTWTTYLSTSDADAGVERIKDAGGQVLVEVMDVLDFGRMVIAADSTGATFGLWQAGTHHGVQLANEHGALTWNEHMSGDLDGAKAFYRKAFDYVYEEVGGPLSYVTISLAEGEDSVGGMGGVDGGSAASWSVYFNVDDVDAAAAKVVELGGSVVDTPEDTPFGRMGTFTDDQGAVFKMITAPAGS
ncbi:VOC family protein [Actinokineospora sp.]|uniref:VOC family protein n=1 Tax=Actinokineospora sp. TaxID=1872133 RepID=UPI004037E6F2